MGFGWGLLKGFDSDPLGLVWTWAFFCAVVERESAGKKATAFVRWVRGCERELRIVFRGKAEIVEREIVLMVVRVGEKSPKKH